MNKLLYLLVSVNLSVTILFIFESAYSQTNKVAQKELVKEAELYFSTGNFRAAIPLYERLNQLNPGNPDYQYNLGFCFLMTNLNKEKAIPYLEFAAENSKNLPFDIFYDLGRAYHFVNHFDEAIVSYEKYINSRNTTKDRVEDAKRRIKMCEDGKIMIQNPVGDTIKNLGEIINSSYSDYAPLITADEELLIFASRRKGSKGGYLDNNGEFYSDIYFSQKKDGEWIKPKNIGALINTDMNEVSVGLSNSGDKLIIYRDEYITGTGDLFISTKKGKSWGKPVLLGEGAQAETDVNIRANETSACFAPDGSEIYFSSNRSGGHGGLDIWKAKLLPTGEWALALNLGAPINTSAEETAPFIHSDGKTLYFSSTAFNSMGGYDIFKSSFDEFGKWSEPENLGYPINSSDDDVHIAVTPDGKKGYYSSTKKGGFGEKDIYLIKFEKKRNTNVVALIRGFVCFKDTFSIQTDSIQTKIIKDTLIPVGAKIKVFSKESEELIGLYNANSETGNFIMIFQPNFKYHIWVEAQGFSLYKEDMFIPYKDEFIEIKKDIILQSLPPKEK